MSESEREIWVRMLRAKVDETRDACAEAAARLRRLEADKQVLERMLRHDDPAADQPILDRAKRSIRAMLGELAQHYADGGTLTSVQACDDMVAAGLFQTRREAGRTVSTVLARAKDFERLEPGVWRYLNYKDSIEADPVGSVASEEG